MCGWLDEYGDLGVELLVGEGEYGLGVVGFVWWIGLLDYGGNFVEYGVYVVEDDG